LGAKTRLALALLMLGGGTDDHDAFLAPDDLAILADFLD